MISASLIALLALAASLPISEAEMLDVWVPQITYPTEGTVWRGGDEVSVTWDASSPPSQITNPDGVIYLVQNDIILFPDELAWDFQLTDGSVSFYVPDVLTGQYQIVLFGDSGNLSPVFTIIHV